MNRILMLAFLIVGAAVLVGCEEKPPPEPPPPPPPTADELYRQIEGTMGLVPAALAEKRDISDEEYGQVLNGFRGKVGQVRGEVNGAEALRRTKNRVAELTRSTTDTPYFNLILLCCDMYDVVEPGSKRFDRARRRATLEKQKPKVRITGLYTDHNTKETNVFVEVTLHTGETFTQTVREGEEFHGLKLLNIIGRDRGVSIEYLATGEPFDVMKE